MLGKPEGLPEIFPRAQPCSPVVIGSMIHYMLLLNVEVHFFEDISKGMQIFNELPQTPNIYDGDIDVSFVLSNQGTLVCNSSFSVLFLNWTSPSLLHTFVAYTTHLSTAIEMIPVILSYINTSRVNAFGRLLVKAKKKKNLVHGNRDSGIK